MRTIAITAALLVMPALAGCGPHPKGKVSGVVKFNGQPLPGGRLTFRPADPKLNTLSAEIDQQGHYSIELPTGEVKVSVDNRELEPRGGASRPVLALPANLPPEVRSKLGGATTGAAPAKPEESAPKASGRYVPIPNKYYDLETAGLEFTVAAGEQTHDFDLTK